MIQVEAAGASTSNEFARRYVANGEFAYSLIETAKLNGVDPQAWLTWVLAQNRRSQNDPPGRTHALSPKCVS